MLKSVRFGAPGWRQGFTRDAISSYFVFRQLRKKGAIPTHLRFQFSMPLVNSIITVGTFPDRDDHPRFRPGYEAALRAEVSEMLENLGKPVDPAIESGGSTGSIFRRSIAAMMLSRRRCRICGPRRPVSILA